MKRTADKTRTAKAAATRVLQFPVGTVQADAGKAGTAAAVEAPARAPRCSTARRIREEMEAEAKRRAAQESAPMDATIHSRRGDGEFFTS